MQTENSTLYFKQGASDKIYKASLEQQGSNFLVNFAYGRRGSTLKTGTKTQTAVPYEKAKKIYDKLVDGKKQKGYIPNEDNANYIHDREQRNTGIYCQLLNPVTKEELEILLEDSDWWTQEKKDGKRLLLQSKEGELTAINRKGLSVGAPQLILDEAKSLGTDFLIDGEAVGEVFYVFDLLHLNKKNLTKESFSARTEKLEKLSFGKAIQIVPLAKTTQEKKEQLEKLQNNNAEGIVLKNHNEAYSAGRPNSGGNQLKYKFYDTASVIVTQINEQRSVAVAVLENEKEIAIGNVTISINKEVPKVNEIIEVRYLYAYKGGSLYQPTFLGVRTDINKNDCLITQLKFKY